MKSLPLIIFHVETNSWKRLVSWVASCVCVRGDERSVRVCLCPCTLSACRARTWDWTSAAVTSWDKDAGACPSFDSRNSWLLRQLISWLHFFLFENLDFVFSKCTSGLLIHFLPLTVCQIVVQGSFWTNLRKTTFHSSPPNPFPEPGFQTRN